MKIKAMDQPSASLIAIGFKLFDDALIEVQYVRVDLP